MLNFVSRIIKTCITIGFGSFYGVSEKSIFFIFWAKAVPLEIEAPEGISLVKSLTTQILMKKWSQSALIFLKYFQKYIVHTQIDPKESDFEGFIAI